MEGTQSLNKDISNNISNNIYIDISKNKTKNIELMNNIEKIIKEDTF